MANDQKPGELSAIAEQTKEQALAVLTTISTS